MLGELRQVQADPPAMLGGFRQVRADPPAMLGGFRQVRADPPAMLGELRQVRADPPAMLGELRQVRADLPAMLGELRQVRADLPAMLGGTRELVFLAAPSSIRRMKSALLACAALFVVACAAPAPAPPPSPAPSPAPEKAAPQKPATDARVYTGAKVHTLDPAHPHAQSLRIENGRITHILDKDPPAELSGERVDLHGATVLPGLIDAHLHLRGLGMSARQLDLKATRSPDEIAARIREAARKAPKGSWIRGRGWDQNDWEKSDFPTHAILDAAAPDHPVWLTRVDGHAIWLNARAMELAGVGKDTKSPSGGEILRDKKGYPTGIFVDNAMDLLEGKLPRASREEIRADLEKGMELCRRAGLVGIHDMGTEPEVLDELRALEKEGRVTLRVYAYLGGAWEKVEPLLQNPPDREGLVEVVGIKLFADGALGSRGAALLSPYSDRKETSGLLVTSENDLKARARKAHAAGYQITIHAIGDRGNRIALDALEHAEGKDHTRGHRIEHAQVLAPAEIARFAALGVVASMQPTHATSDMPWAEARLGAERIKGAYAWKTLLSARATLVFGSDAPVEGESPWLGIYAAVTRKATDGKPEGGWRAEERLSVEEALRAFSTTPAKVVGEKDLGVIREGAWADLSVVDRDPFVVPSDALREMRSLRTVVAGEEVFVAE